MKNLLILISALSAGAAGANIYRVHNDLIVKTIKITEDKAEACRAISRMAADAKTYAYMGNVESVEVSDCYEGEVDEYNEVTIYADVKVRTAMDLTQAPFKKK